MIGRGSDPTWLDSMCFLEPLGNIAEVAVPKESHCRALTPMASDHLPNKTGGKSSVLDGLIPLGWTEALKPSPALPRYNSRVWRQGCLRKSLETFSPWWRITVCKEWFLRWSPLLGEQNESRKRSH